MHLFYDPAIEPPLHTLVGQEGKHAVKVMRLGPGDMVALTDGRGNMYRGVVEKAEETECRIAITGKEDASRRPYGLTMAVAPTKNADRYEWFLEKATEAGMDRFVPVVCQRSERKVFRSDRSLRVITSAVKQSFSAWHPVLEEPVTFKALVEREFEGEKFIAHCDPGFAREHLADVMSPGRNYVVMIGPEGDFSPAEIELALSRGFTGVSLGTSRLRTETAAVAAAIIAATVNR